MSLHLPLMNAVPVKAESFTFKRSPLSTPSDWLRDEVSKVFWGGSWNGSTFPKSALSHVVSRERCLHPSLCAENDLDKCALVNRRDETGETAGSPLACRSQHAVDGLQNMDRSSSKASFPNQRATRASSCCPNVQRLEPGSPL